MKTLFLTLRTFSLFEFLGDIEKLSDVKSAVCQTDKVQDGPVDEYKWKVELKVSDTFNPSIMITWAFIADKSETLSNPKYFLFRKEVISNRSKRIEYKKADQPKESLAVSV